MIYNLHSTTSTTRVFLSLLRHHLMYPFCLLRHYSVIRMKTNRYTDILYHEWLIIPTLFLQIALGVFSYILLKAEYKSICETWSLQCWNVQHRAKPAYDDLFVSYQQSLLYLSYKSIVNLKLHFLLKCTLQLKLQGRQSHKGQLVSWKSPRDHITKSSPLHWPALLQSYISGYLDRLFPPNQILIPESIFLDSMAITNFATTSDPPTPFEMCAHKRMGVRVSHQWWAGQKDDDWDLMEYRIPTRVLYPRSPQLAKMGIEKAEDWVQLQTESTWRTLHLDRWTNSAFSILGPVDDLYREPIELTGGNVNVLTIWVSSIFRVAHCPGLYRSKAASCVDVARNKMRKDVFRPSLLWSVMWSYLHKLRTVYSSVSVWQLHFDDTIFNIPLRDWFSWAFSIP